MVIIFWLVTPLVSAIFTLANVTSTSVGDASLQSALPPVGKQHLDLTSSFMMSAYRQMWMNEASPPFTTKEGALLPFTLDSSSGKASHSDNNLGHILSANDTWTAATMMYTTSIECSPAKVVGKESDIRYDNGKGCVTNPGSIGAGTSNKYKALYIGYWMDQHIDFALSRMGCASLENQHTFLAYWNVRSDGQSNTTALFCEPAYWYQVVNATVLASNFTVVEVVPLEPKKPLLEDRFNISNFEYILNTGTPAQSKRADIIDTTTVVNQRSHLEIMGISPTSTVTNMIGFALGTTQWELPAYSNATLLASSFERAHQLLFALAVRSLLSDEKVVPDPRPCFHRQNLRAIVVVRPLALTVEITLGIVAVLTLALMYRCFTRPSELQCDPSSLHDVMIMIDPKESPSITAESERMEESTTLRMVLQKGYFCVRNNVMLDAARNAQLSEQHLTHKDLKPLHVHKDKEVVPSRPWETRIWVATVLTGALCAMLITLVTLQKSIADRHGLSLPSSSPVINQMVTSYVPVVLSTFLEPLWILLNRIRCVLQPFESLRQGDAGPSRSLDLRYTSLPPQLAFWRAVRARHWLLVAVCAIGISANLLTVALSGLFNTRVVSLESTATFAMQRAPQFQRTDESSPESTPDGGIFYVAASSISNDALLPPWTSNETFFVPFIPNMSQGSAPNETYTANTQGFGTNMDCKQIEHNTTAYISFGALKKTAPLLNAPQVAIGDGRTCNDPSSGVLGGQNNSMSASELLTGLAAPDDNAATKSSECENLIFAGFLRGNLSVSFNYYKTENTLGEKSPDIVAVNSLASTWIICKPNLLVASYEVTVDLNGRVKKALRTGPYASDLAPYFTPNLSLTNFMNETRRVFMAGANTADYWHDDVYVDSWFAYLIKLLDKGAGITDPHQSVPSFVKVLPLIQDLYSRVFAIQLGLNVDWLAPAKSDALVVGIKAMPEERLFMSQPAFIIAIVLLMLNVLVAIAYYVRRPKKMPLTMPITIASVFQLFSGSGLVAESQRAEGLRDDWKIAFGRFIGTSGKPHIGIERRPFVVPLR